VLHRRLLHFPSSTPLSIFTTQAASVNLKVFLSLASLSSDVYDDDDVDGIMYNRNSPLRLDFSTCTVPAAAVVFNAETSSPESSSGGAMDNSPAVDPSDDDVSFS
jgi:hypothetical protein